MGKEIVYIGELDADVDDVVAAEYLHNMGVLKCVVLDPLPKTDIGKQRANVLKNLGITIFTKMPPVAKYVFVGGALTEVARYITTHNIDALVMNGGFVGNNIIPENEQIKKFKNKTMVRTFNFNCDVLSTDKVLKSSEKQIGKIILVGKNVCHNEINTPLNLWKDECFSPLFVKHHVSATKLQHDMLACHEGLALLHLIDIAPYCNFTKVKPVNDGIHGTMTKWGSVLPNESSPYREVLAAISYNNISKG